MEKGLKNLIFNIQLRFRTSAMVLEDLAVGLNEEFPNGGIRAIPEYLGAQEALKKYDRVLTSR